LLRAKRVEKRGSDPRRKLSVGDKLISGKVFERRSLKGRATLVNLAFSLFLKIETWIKESRVGQKERKREREKRRRRSNQEKPSRELERKERERAKPPKTEKVPA